MTPKATGSRLPGRLIKQRAWLTVAEAARYLALVFGEEVTEADILRLGLDGTLKLSVHFVNFTRAKRYLDPRLGYAEASEELRAIEASKAAGLPEPVFEQRAPTPLEEECSRVVTLRDAVYDLPLVGGEKLDVEREYQRHAGGPAITLTSFDGTFVDSEDGIRFQLQRETQNAKRPIETNGLPYYLEPDVEPYRLGDVDSLYERAPSLPPDSVLVVRTSALREMEMRSLDLTESESSHDSIERPLAQRERVTLLTIISVLADEVGIDVSKPSKAGLAIEALTDAKAVRVAARTVEDHLKRIPDALERKAKSSS